MSSWFIYYHVEKLRNQPAQRSWISKHAAQRSPTFQMWTSGIMTLCFIANLRCLQFALRAKFCCAEELITISIDVCLIIFWQLQAHIIHLRSSEPQLALHFEEMINSENFCFYKHVILGFKCVKVAIVFSFRKYWSGRSFCFMLLIS